MTIIFLTIIFYKDFFFLLTIMSVSSIYAVPLFFCCVLISTTDSAYGFHDEDRVLHCIVAILKHHSIRRQDRAWKSRYEVTPWTMYKPVDVFMACNTTTTLEVGSIDEGVLTLTVRGMNRRECVSRCCVVLTRYTHGPVSLAYDKSPRRRSEPLSYRRGYFNILKFQP